MPSINLTSLSLTILPGLNQLFWVNWSRADTPLVVHTLPIIHVDPFGVIIFPSPLPYTFDVPNTDIIVRTRNAKKCEEWFEKTFEIAELVELTIDLTP